MKVKKGTIITIAVVSFIVVFGGLVAGAVILAKRIGPMVERGIEQAEDDGQPGTQDAINELSEKYNANNWTENLETNYSFEVKEKARQINGQTIVFTGELSDITKENGQYFVFLHDESLTDTPFYSVYKLKCTEEQVKRLTDTGQEASEETYFVYAAAAKVDRVEELPQKEGEVWSTPMVIHGTLLDFIKV